MNFPININDLLTARTVEWERLDMREFRFLSRRYRNRRVGEFLEELEMTEGRGTGIPKMLRAIQANGSPAPVFHTDDDRTYFLVEFFIHPIFAETADDKGAGFTGSEKTSEKTSEKILRLLKQFPEMTIEQLAAEIGVTARSVERNLKKLKETNRLHRIGPDKGGRWEVRND
ncbi:MAG: winged helix-turn-helix transcriptional regulator [Nitrospiraceae bacterium]|nr:winged helix-turn-helix transcriptional regulator [Nitrospiraceae bacterium]